MSIQTEITINASRERVWQHLTDFERYPEWNPFIVEIKGRAIKGSRLQNTLKNGDRNFVFKPIVIEADKPQKFSWLGRLWMKGIFDGYHFFILENQPAGGVRLIHGERFSGLLSRMILKKIGDQTRKNFEAMNIALKTLAESGSQPAE